MAANRYAGIIFDLDGTLYEHRLLKIRLALRQIRHLRYLMRIEKGRDAVRLMSFSGSKDLLTAIGNRCFPEDPRAFLDWYERRFYPSFIAELKPHMLRPGTQAQLRNLKKRGIKLSICSDYGRIGGRLQALGLEPELFDALLSAEDCGHLKPQLICYKKILLHFKLEPQQVLVIGDRFATDGVAAAEIGASFQLIKSDRDWLQLFKMLESSQ